jgi:polar amino acid transport system substrate-binding protein
VAGDQPFVEVRDGELDGLSVRLWKAVQTDMGLTAELRRATSFDEVISDVQAGRADVAVGPIAITAARAHLVDFTQPYYSDRLAIASIADRGAWAEVRPFVVFGGIALGALVILLFIFGNVIWLFERNCEGSTLPHEWGEGVEKGMWLGVVTLTTVGYGDVVPVSRVGRALTALWMVAAMLVVSGCVGGVASMLTELRLKSASISSPEQLSGRRVAVLKSSRSLVYAGRWHATVIPAESLEACMHLLMTKRVDAVMYHRAELQYYVAKHPNDPVRISAESYDPHGYGFALRRGNPLVANLNISLLRLQENDMLDQLEQAYLSGATVR